MKAKLSLRKIIATIVVSAMSVALIPKIAGTDKVIAATASDKDQSNTSFGVSAIGNPTSTGTSSDWAGSYVYFGTYEGNPIKFRVLQKDSTAHTASPALFLDSDVILETMSFDDDSDSWADSEVKTWLNDTFLKSPNFTSVEIGAVPDTRIEKEHDLTQSTVSRWAVSVYSKYVPLSGEQVFLLDAEEASNSLYGYDITDESCVSRIKTGGDGAWWLRSAFKAGPGRAGIVSDTGYLGSIKVDTSTYGVAPALNVNQGSIIFTTEVESESNAYKLTLSDSNLTISVPDGQNVAVSGTTVTVPYQIGGDNAGTAMRASILITDGEWDAAGTKIILYGELGASTASSGTFTLPSECDIDRWGTDYHVYILAEDINGEKETDYASTPVEIMQTYTATYKVVNGTWSDGTTKDLIETVVKDSSPVSIPVGMIASSGYEGGSWDTDPSTASMSANTTFTYTFDAVPTYAVTVQNDGNGKASADVTSGPKGTEVTLTATPDSGYQFKEWQVVSGGVTIQDNKFTIGTSDVTVKAVFEAESIKPGTYTIAGDGDITWTEGDTDLVVTVKRSEDDEHCFDRYEYAAIDGTKLTSEQASAARGSTVITIKSDFLKTLGEGKHTFLVNFTDASLGTTITIVKKDSDTASIPATGEHQSPVMYLGIALAVMACGMSVFVLAKKRKEEM